jgi:uncharacterized protein YcfJ
MRLPFRTLASLGALGLAATAQAQTSPEYGTARVVTTTTEIETDANGVETITRTRRIEAPHAMPAATQAPPTYAPVVFEREQWLEECRRRTAVRKDDDDGLIIGGLLGALVGGVAGYEIAGAGDRVLGSVLGVGGGGLLGGLIGKLIDDNEDEDAAPFNCETALDSYMSQPGAATTRVASRSIPAPVYAAPPVYDYGYGYPAGYGYAQPLQTVLVPVRTQVEQQVVVRETMREESAPR